MVNSEDPDEMLQNVKKIIQKDSLLQSIRNWIRLKLVLPATRVQVNKVLLNDEPAKLNGSGLFQKFNMHEN